MIKVLELTTKDWLTGESENYFGSRGGIFYAAKGISPFVSPYKGSNDFGLLQTAAAPVKFTSGVVKDDVRAFANKATSANNGYLYGLGANGHFYKIDLSDTTVPETISDLRATASSVITDPAGGLDLYKSFAFYTQKTQVGRWDVTSSYPTNWSDSFMTGLQDYAYHPTHLFGDKLWIGDKNRMAKITDSRTLVTGSDILDFASDYRVQCINDDGLKLVMGITKNLGDIVIGGDTKVIFWDTYSPSWNREWPIPDVNIVSIVNAGGWNYAFTSGGTYKFSYSTSPRKINVNINAPYGRNNVTDVLGNMIYSGNRENSISAYGSPLPGYPAVLYRPFTGWSSAQAVAALTTKARRYYIYFSTNDGSLYRQSLLGGGATGLIADTIAIPLGRKVRVKAIKVLLGNYLVAGDNLKIYTQTDPDDAFSLFGTVSYAKHGKVKRVTLRAMRSSSHLKVADKDLALRFGYDGGNVKVRDLEVWGEPYIDAEK